MASLPPRAIAARLDVPLNTVRSRLARGLERLRTDLDAEHGRERWLGALAPVAVTGGGVLRAAAILVPLLLAGAAAVPLTLAALRAPERDVTAAIVPAAAPAAAPAEAGASALDDVRERIPTTPAARPTAASSGTLTIAVEDARTGAPLTDLEYVVFSERGGYRLHASGVTDAQGRARVGDLPENTILVQTARRPPYAPARRATWLVAGSAAELLVRVDHGGSLAGRVVDDLGRPVAGVEVHGPVQLRTDLDRAWGTRTELMGTTDELGRFRVEALASLPRAVWVVDGEERPERWDAPKLWLRDPRFGTWEQAEASAQVRPGEDADAGDVVLARAVRLAGRVLDGAGRPLAGALVTAHHRRSWRLRGGPDFGDGAGMPQDHPDFELLPGEMVTDASGTFVVERPWASQEHVSALAVRTASGAAETFPVPAVEPGDSREGLSLVVEGTEVVSVTFLRGDGSRIEGLERGMDRGTRSQVFLGAVQVRLLDDRGQPFELQRSLDGDGVLRLQLPVPAASVRTLNLGVAGFEEHFESLPGGLSTDEPHVVRLRELPRLRLAVEVGRFAGYGVNVEPCLIPPDEREGKAFECCGLGSRASQPEVEGDVAVFDVPVGTVRPFWVYVTAYGFQSRLPSQAHGPFVPGEGPHAFALTGEAEPVREKERQPPGPSEPGEAAHEVPRQLLELGASDVLDALLDTTLRVRVRRADGTPFEGKVLTADDQLQVDEDGWTVLPHRRGRPPASLLAIEPYGVGSGWQTVPLLGEEATLAPWREVEVVVRGFDADLRGASLRVGLFPTGAELEDERLWGLPSCREVASEDPFERRFRTRAAAGHVDVVGGGRILSMERATIEVAPAVDGVQRFVVYGR